MKKLFLTFAILCSAICATAQQSLIIKAGTVVSMQARNSVKAADVEEGQTVDFTVTNDIKVNGTVVIERGTLVKGVVSEARRSTVAGTKGKLTINISKLILPNGEPLFFSDTAVRISGKNRTPLAVVAALFVWPCIFIPGTRAEMPAGYEVLATVASNTEIQI